MKNKLRFLLFIILGIIVSCTDSTIGNINENQNQGLAYRSAVAYDANNVKLGYCIPSAFSIQIISNLGYYYTLMWDGTILDYVCYYTEPNQLGTPFFQYVYKSNSKIIIYANALLYTYRDFDQYGNTVPDLSITSYQSYYSSGTCANCTLQSVTPPNKAYALKPITKLEAGIPNTISLPIQIKYE